MLVYSTKRSWVKAPTFLRVNKSSSGKSHLPSCSHSYAPQQQQQAFQRAFSEKVTCLMRPREWAGIKSWSVVPGWGQLHIRALPSWSQRLRNNNISEHSWERKFAGCDGRSPLPREMWRFPWCVVTEDIFSFLANFLRKYEGNNRDCQNWLYGFSPSYLCRAFLIFFNFVLWFYCSLMVSNYRSLKGI